MLDYALAVDDFVFFRFWQKVKVMWSITLSC